VAAAAFPPFANKGKWFLEGEMVGGGGGGGEGKNRFWPHSASFVFRTDKQAKETGQVYVYRYI
jgi:hypothetical protein